MSIEILKGFDSYALLALRLAIASIFLVHGLKKWPDWKAKANEQLPQSFLNKMRILSVAEPLGALSLLLGFLTPLAALGLSIIMIGAIYTKITIWQKKFTGDGGWEFDLILLAANTILIVFGAGNISLDWIIG